MSLSTSNEPGVVLGSKPDGTVIPVNKEVLLTPPSSPPSRTSSIRRQHTEHPPLPETLQSLPSSGTQVRATIDQLTEPDVAHHDIRAPGANAIPLDDMKGVPYFPDRSQLNGQPKTEVWNLIRRFDKQVSHVKVVSAIPAGQLDFQTAADDEFAPEGLRSNLERAYKLTLKSKPVLMSAIEPYRVSRPVAIVYGLRAAGRHIATLANWHHRRRTACFAAGYFFAWYFHILMFSSVAMIMTLIVHPPSRTLLFPSDPLPLGPQPYADSARIIDRIAPTAATVTDKVADRIPLDPATESAIPATKETEEDGDEYDTAIWQQAKPIAQVLAVISDTWERFENALNPVPPFPEHDARRKLAAYLAPILLVAPFITPALVVRGLTFALGVVLFGWPVVRSATVRSIKYLNASHPRWTEALDPRHHILHGVPTNAQLTIALLRVAEAQRAPIPPPPANAPGPGDDPYAAGFAQDDDLTDDTDEDDQNLPSPPALPDQLTTTAVADEQYHAHQAAEQKGEHDAQIAAAIDTNDTPTVKSRVAHKAKGAMARVLRRSARVTGKTVEHGRHARAAVQDHIPGAGSGDTNTASIVPPEAVDTRTRPARDGPDSFAARHHGRRGHVVLNSGTITFLPAATKSRLAMLKPGHGDGGLGGDEAPENDKDGAPAAAIALIDIVDIRKVGGPSTARELLAGAVEDNTEGGGAGGAGHGFGGGHGIPGGLVIADRWCHTEAFTTIDRRDELFDRLVAASPVRWEIGSAWD